MNYLLMTTISAAFVFGMVLALLGSLKLALAKRLNLGEGRVGGLLSALNAALIPMMVLTGWLIDHWNVQYVLVLSSVLTAIGILGLSMRPTYGRAFLSVLLAGFGAAGLSTGAIVLMAHAFPDYWPMSASINLGCVFFALGALVTPVLTDLLLRWLEFRRTAALLALLCLAPAFAVVAAYAAQAPLPGFPPDPGKVPDVNVLIDNHRLWLAAAVFLFYAPLEGAVSVWTTTYLTELGHGERGAAWLLSSFWSAFLISRLVMALLMIWMQRHAEWNLWLLVLLSVLAAAVLGNLAGSARRGSARNWLLLLGLVLGPIFPTLIGVVFQVKGLEDARGTVYGVIFAAGSLGSLVLAPVIGARARARNVQSALWIPMVLALFMIIASLAFSITGPLGK
jgi:fucose permease